MADEEKSALNQEQDENVTENMNSNQTENKTDDAPNIYFENGQLTFVGQESEKIPKQLIEDYSAVTTRLDLSFNRLSFLDGLERFTSLEELVLDSNFIDDAVRFPLLKRLQTLTLNKNQLNNLDSLLDQIHDNLPSLTYLSLLGNTACPNQLSSQDNDDDDYQRYRYYVLFRLPNLKFLDSSEVKPAEHAEAKRSGPYMKVVRVDDSEINDKDHAKDLSKDIYSPLPDKARDDEDPIATYGKNKYMYFGRHSEGNRFIRNNDL